MPDSAPPRVDPHATTRDDLLAVLPDMFFRLDAAGVFLEFRGDEHDLAVPPGRFLGRPIREVLPPDLAELLYGEVNRALATGRLQVVEYELPVGSGRHFEARTVAAGGDAVMVVRNVTERRQAEAALRRTEGERASLERRLAQADRLAALGTLAGGLAHEINNPLTYVRGGLELVAEGLRQAGLPEQALAPLREALDDARGGVERIRRTVQGLQALASPEGRPRAPLGLPVVADRAAALVMAEIRHRARFAREDLGAPPVLGDEGGLTQLVVGLLLNAAQAVGAGQGAEDEIKVVTRAEGGQAVLEVLDTGHGIAPDHLPRVFDPFFTTRPPGAGTGLGLSFGHAIALAHGGVLTLENRPGGGSVARLVLPPAPLAAVEATPAAATGPAGGRRRVLVVDDEPRVLATTARLLRAEFDVDVAGDGRVALERIQGGARYHAILCDLMMPAMTGMAFHAALVRQAPDLAERCAFISGGAFTDEARRFLESAPGPLVEKPFEAEALRVVVRRLASG